MPGARVPGVATWWFLLPKCYTDFVQSRSDTLASLQGTMSMDQAVAVCLLIPQTVCPHSGVLTVGVKAGA